MSLFEDLGSEASAWASIGGMPSKEEIYFKTCPLLEFLELISMADFKFRYEPGDPKTRGIEVRHDILKGWISRLKEERKP